MVPPAGPSASPGPPSPETTQVLLALARAGDGGARERLFARFLPKLEDWAHHRLPPTARGLADTDDLVQVTLVRALNRIEAFEPRREGAFLAYIRTILLNVVREEIRRARPLMRREELDDHVPARNRSQLDELIGAETLERYDQGLAQLTEEQREAVILRLEFGYSHAEVAEALGKSSPDAARMTIARALAALGALLDDAAHT
jgi:RNA polymerase sigma-70 factor (ECF subfamily)